MRCTHRVIRIETEADGCYWVHCNSCGKNGPAKHSMMLALMAWALKLTDQHPRRKKCT